MAGLLEDLDAEQRAAAEAVAGPVCIIAGAGTGKTRTVTHRLAHGIATGAVAPSTALAITHSRKAAGELGERLNALGAGGVDAYTFHAAALRVVRRYWDRTGRPEAAPAVVSEGDAWRLWRDAVRAVTRVEPDTAAVRDAIDEVGWARARLVPPEDYPAAAIKADRHPGMEASTVVACWASYEQAKRRLGRVDFADLLELAAGLLEDDDAPALSVRARWAHVTVDEYQDTDPAQQRFLDAIVGGREDLCVVGDPRQAIYSWKGADPSYLVDFPRRHPRARVFDLTRNYRSSPQVLDWANRVARTSGTKPLVATRAGGPAPKVFRADNEGGEAAWVAGAARRAISGGTPPAEIAVLYRFNATQARFEAALARAGIATVVAEDTTFFDRDEIRAVLLPFGRAARAQPDTPGLELMTSSLHRAGFDRDRPPDGLGAARARWESHRALIELVETSPEMAKADARALLDQINALAVRTLGPRVPGVTLATLHRAKGLEWDIVFVVGVTDGALPSAFATTPDELAEEERLLHVGISRARHELHLTWPATNARGWDNRPSPYLDLLPTTAGRRKEFAPRRSTARPSGHSGGKVGPTPAGLSCPHCTEPLKGMAARGLGVCASCVTRAPGQLGVRARALEKTVGEAAAARGLAVDKLVTASGFMRLLYQRPHSADGVAATSGVSLSGRWAQAAADVLAD
ncbi:MAG TPA: ATP-dependent helicase [Acidimicrobiales bacterium]|nr:ATP-dependent helicase [Acidimicrobiales bacterium]